ncbi:MULTISPECIES: DUF732 domain-containing protein [unclassified Blastococcus]
MTLSCLAGLMVAALLTAMVVTAKDDRTPEAAASPTVTITAAAPSVEEEMTFEPPAETSWSDPPAAPPMPSADGHSLEEQAYLMVMGTDAYWGTYSDEDLLLAGRGVCVYLESGRGDIYTIGVELMNGPDNVPYDAAATLVGSAVASFCPAFEGQL